jgi:hypothetical protein
MDDSTWHLSINCGIILKLILKNTVSEDLNWIHMIQARIR